MHAPAGVVDGGDVVRRVSRHSRRRVAEDHLERRRREWLRVRVRPRVDDLVVAVHHARLGAAVVRAVHHAQAGDDQHEAREQRAPGAPERAPLLPGLLLGVRARAETRVAVVTGPHREPARPGRVHHVVRLAVGEVVRVPTA